MPNHYHLLVETPAGNLSRAIQWLNTSYGVWFKRRHQRVGHLLQGRFQSVVVEGGTWAGQLSEYIHLNPVWIEELGWGKAQRQAEGSGGGAAPSSPVVGERRRRLRAYRWSSYRADAGYARPPEWLCLERILGGGGGNPAPRRAGYGQRVEGAVRQSVPPAVWEQWQAGLALWVGRRYGGLSLRELGREAGMDYGAVAMLVRRFVARAGPDRETAARQAKLAQEMFNVKM